MISCRQCGVPCRKGNKGLCPGCYVAHRAAGHGSSEYQRNAAAVVSAATEFLRAGGSLRCGICGLPLTLASKISAGHIIRLRDGGGHSLEIFGRCTPAATALTAEPAPAAPALTAEPPAPGFVLPRAPFSPAPRWWQASTR